MIIYVAWTLQKGFHVRVGHMSKNVTLREFKMVACPSLEAMLYLHLYKKENSVNKSDINFIKHKTLKICEGNCKSFTQALT